MAIHGGGIEPGTTEIAEAVAGTEHTFYTFSGLKPRGNSRLHITSIKFDEPAANRIAEQACLVISVHGSKERERVVYVGGRNEPLKERLCRALNRGGFAVAESFRLPGRSPLNICNRCRSGQGVQMEISRGLRLQMFGDLSRARRRGSTTRTFETFVSVVREVISGTQEPAGFS
jgi:phage replication-related protein YjqB (UPF0714/DUF867 family)